MNSYLKVILPTYRKSIMIENLDKINLSEKLNNYSFYLKKKNKNKYVIYKEDPSWDLSNELIYICKVKSNSSILTIIVNYKTASYFGYGIFIAMFTLLVWPIDNIVKLLIAILPYLFMLIKIKLKSKKYIPIIEEMLK